MSFADTDVRYDLTARPEVLCDRAFEYPAWKGERVSAVAVLYSEADMHDVSVRVTDLKSETGRIASEIVSASFVRYIWADEMIDGYDQCGPRVRSEHDSLLVADMIDNAASLSRTNRCMSR